MCLIERNTDRLAVDATKIHPGALRSLDDLLRFVAARFDSQRVEELLVLELEAKLGQPAREDFGEPMDPRGYCPQAFRAVIDRVHAGHDRQQYLGGADVAGGFLAANVLLASLQCHPQRRFALSVLGNTDDPPWHVPRICRAGREVSRVRSAIAQW